jgi:hypothetical protein
MRSIYASILLFYPAEYKNVFGSEILSTVEEARRQLGTQGLLKRSAFICSETVGLLTGLIREWSAKWIHREAYITARCSVQGAAPGVTQISELEDRLRILIRNMEFAIAHHDFPKARFYSDEERTTRALLERLTGGPRS